MRSHIKIHNVRFIPATPQKMGQGLLGYISCTLNGLLLLDGIVLRRTLEGSLTLSFPARKDGMGKKHPFIKPQNTDIREEIRAQVLDALGILETEGKTAC